MVFVLHDTSFTRRISSFINYFAKPAAIGTVQLINPTLIEKVNDNSQLTIEEHITLFSCAYRYNDVPSISCIEATLFVIILRRVCMDKEGFINYMAQSLECTEEDAKTAIDMFTEGVSLAMYEGYNIEIDNLGKFGISSIPARKIRVPKTDKIVTVKQHKRLYFTPARDLKISCNF